MPGPIRKLSSLLVSQIAAGEVIERPASVVKELVENALDAGATRIDVLVEEGGRELIRIADDGRGIPSHELPLALAPHATSKIASADDLAAIATMGFRGEALASILSVSRVKMTSRAQGAPQGAMVEGSGDTLSTPKPAACAQGTVVEVRNLFFNTPARRKFMRAASTEFGHIHDSFSRLAMAHPTVGFKLTHGERIAQDLPPAQTPRQRCLALLGKEVEEGMLEFTSDGRGVALWGLAGVPSLARATGKHQYLFVNGRTVRDKNILHAVRESYRGLIEPSLQPMVVLFLTLDPSLVDVNVHPTKSEVRFADTNAVHSQVLAAVRGRLLETDLVPRVAPASGFNRFGVAPFTLAPSIHPDRLDLNAPAAPPRTTRDFVESFRHMDPTQKRLVYDEVRKEVAPEPDPPRDAVAPLPRIAESKPILQIHNSYIVTQDENGIVIIDQHALHERMMFETLLDRVRSAGKLESQRLLTPAVVRATPSRVETLERLTGLLNKIGIEAQPIGPESIAVHAFPSLLFDRRVDPAQFIDDLLDRAEEEGFVENPSDEAALHEVLDMMSCKAAIKAGDRLRDGELEELLSRREHVERNSSCPHGRPTTIRLSIRDLEKHFQRI